MLPLNKISFTYRNEKTWNGYAFDEAKSALQKYIRRGNADKACFIAAEMDLFRQFKEGKKLWTNFYNRIRVIMLEDVGIQSPHIFIHSNNLLMKWKESTELKSKELIELIVILCKNFHSRYLNYIRKYFVLKGTSLRGKLNNDALVDFCTNGKIAFEIENVKYYTEQFLYCLEKKSIIVFYWIQMILNIEQLNHKYPRSKKTGFYLFYILERYFQYVSISSELNIIFNILKEWYTNLKVKENFLCISFVVYSYIFSDSLDWESSFLSHSYPYSVYDNVLSSNKITLDWYVFDKHTKRGKRLGKGYYDFAMEGCLVANEWSSFKHYSLLKNHYLNNYKKTDQVKNEKTTFTWILRSQLVTGKNKQDVYFAKDKSNQTVVVKGPYERLNSVETIFNIYSVLFLFEEINYVSYSIYEMNVELDYCGPLGIRNQWKNKENKKGYFLLSENLFPDYFPRKIKSSKLWINEPVLDVEKVIELYPEYNFGIPSQLSSSAMMSFIFQYAIKYVFMIPDNAYRNFIVRKDKVYLIDCEDILVSNHCKFSKKERFLFENFIRKHKSEIESVLCKWKENDKRWKCVQHCLNLSIDEISRMKKNCDLFIPCFLNEE